MGHRKQMNKNKSVWN